MTHDEKWLAAGLTRHRLDDGAPFYEGRLPAARMWDETAFAEGWHLHPADRPVIIMVGREVAIPRFQQAYGADYRFSGQVSRALPVPPLLVPLLEWARAAIDDRLNGLLVNWYEGPGHYIGPHHDRPDDMAEDAPIVTISFGETRVFRLSRGKGEEHQVRDFEATDGTVFVLPQPTNAAWKHAVPKAARYRGRRISVTIRGFVEGE